MSRTPSPAQLAVCAAVEDPSTTHLVVEALAGSGKTTTIVDAMSHVPRGQTILAVAFNSSIAAELKERVPEGVDCRTLHSYGYSAVRRADGKGREPDGSLTARMAKALMGGDYASREARTAVVKLVGIGKACLKGDADALDVLADAYGIDMPEGWDRRVLIRNAQQIMSECARMTKGPIDFDDMIWLPVVRGLKLWQYDWVFVDETQDLNPCQLSLVRRAVKPGGHIVAVGDRRQAIYGFRGADRDAIPRMIRELKAQVLPLNVTYRCGTAIVEQAARLVPALQAAPGAASGIVRHSSEATLERDARPGDFVISRVNAPLVSLCYRWLQAGRRARIQGRDIGAGLASWIRSTNAQDVPQLTRLIEQWRSAECKRLEELDRDVTATLDKAECLHALSEGCGSIADVLARIDRLFADDGEAAILLTSTHKAKGREADRVWLLRDTYRPRVSEEEANLLYVAITRAKKELIYVSATAQEAEEAA